MSLGSEARSSLTFLTSPLRAASWMGPQKAGVATMTAPSASTTAHTMRLEEGLWKLTNVFIFFDLSDWLVGQTSLPDREHTATLHEGHTPRDGRKGGQVACNLQEQDFDCKVRLGRSRKAPDSSEMALA